MKKKKRQKKILILTASPIRDKVVDDLIAEELRRRGNKVWVKACLRQGRQSALKFKPDVCVMPPIRNVHSRDMVEVMKRWGMGVVSRHTEPSCDWPDFKRMNPKEKAAILGPWPYRVDMELVWSPDEAEILNKRGVPFKTFPIGAVACDVFFREDLINKARDRTAFNLKYKFDDSKKNLLIASPWGFADSAPDLRVDETTEAKQDIAGRDRHFDMISKVANSLRDKWNILISVHPGVAEEPYKELANRLQVPLDVASPSFELKVNSDALIHAGSTMAIGMHLLGLPSYQFGDVNAKTVDNWWGKPESDISKVSPYFHDAESLAKAIRNYKPVSNANKKTLKRLESGRYGRMDGKATQRAATLINKLTGKMKINWPRSTRDYSQLSIIRYPQDIIQQARCGICGMDFCLLTDRWLSILCQSQKLDMAKLRPKYNNCCPHCGARFHGKT